MPQILKSTKTVSAKDIKRAWTVVDVEGQVLGRIVNEITKILQGKNKTDYIPHLDVGDHVIVINAKKVLVTGKKADTKTYSYYSGYPGGMKNVSFKTLLDKKPEEIIRHAVSGMLPKNKLRDKRLARLHVYPEATHPYAERVSSTSKV